MTELDTHDLAWAAGFLDGEGTFTIAVTSDGYFYAQVHATQVDVRPLFKLKEMFGGSIRVARTSYGNRRQAYRYIVATAKARELVKAVRPFLIVKGEHADVLLELGALLEAHGRGAKKLTEIELNQRASLKARIMELNQRGVS